MRLQRVERALGSEVVLTVVGGRAVQLEAWLDDLWADINLFERTFSRFLDESELSHVNAQAGLPTPVTPEFAKLAQAAAAMARRTDGLYNPFTLPALQRAGYQGSWPNPEQLGDAPDYRDRTVVTAQLLRVADETVELPPGTALDFGGIGKGYLLDQLADRLERSGCVDYWLSLGGDIIARGHEDDGRLWQLAVARADGSTEPAATIAVSANQRMAVATSGTIRRRGPGWHHLINPRTGRPAETDVLTATVCRTSATEADVFAKCLVLLGSGRAASFMRRQGIDRAALQIATESGIIVETKGL